MTDKQKRSTLKIVRKIAIAFIIVGLLVYIGYWIVYYFAMVKSNKETAIIRCKENQAAFFDGQITRIDRYEYSSFMKSNFFGIEIETNDTAKQYITYQFDLKSRKTLLDLANVGQRVKKERDSSNFILFTTKNEQAKFKLPYCE